MRRYVAGAILLSLLTAVLAFSQNAQLAGIVTDPSGALVPGVTITVTNTDTGVVTTTLTNEAGAYSFPSLQPGKAYRVTASLPGFQTQTVTAIELAASVRQNFLLQLSTAQTTVEVSADAISAISANSASVGDVLPETRINNLPNVGNNVLSLLNVLPGLRVSLGGTQLNTIGGLGLNTMNITRDGLTSNDTRFGPEGDLSANTTLPNFGGLGVMSPTTINPDLVGEIRLILSPVDAELGRGNSQIQIQTRSGTNKYTGSAVWNIQNTALNANTWGNNNDVDPRTGEWKPTTPDWRNVNQYTVSFGGPIIRNKTFFFALWDQNISALRSTQNLRVLTNEARNGIVRYWEGWTNDSANPDNNAQLPTTAGNPTIASVDVFGKPLMPQFWPDGSAYNGRLVCFSVFGTTTASGAPFAAGPNTNLCPSGVDSAGRAYTALAMTPPAGAPSWDPRRPGSFNQAGYFSKILKTIPEPNDFDNDFGGDGLVTANYRYMLTRNIGDPTFYNETLVGNDPYSNRKQLNIKIDQNFKSHRISGGWTYQMDDNVVFRGDLPNGLEGVSSRRPNVLTVSVTTTLSPNLLNEGRFGININKGQQNPPWTSTDDSIREEAQQFLTQGGVRPGTSNRYPVLVRPQAGLGTVFGPLNDDASLAFDNFNMGTRLNAATVNVASFNDPLYQLNDTISWTHGKHVFKFGGDYRAPRTSGYSFQPYVTAFYGNLGGAATASPLASESAGTGTPSLGATTVTVPAGQTYASLWAATATNTQAFNFRQTSRTIAANLAYLLTDSIGGLNTPYWISSANDATQGIAGWQDITTASNRFRNSVASDYAFFAKDDYKIRPDLTLNLGVRYEYYAPPYLKGGLTSSIIGLGDGLFGASQSAAAGGQLFNNWLQPGNLYLTNYGSGAAIPAGGAPLDCKPGLTQSPFLPTSTCDPNSLTTIQYVGSGSPNPGGSILPRDRNNFGPAIGFAWQVPWFGAGKTTVRGGYQVTFQRAQVQDQVLSGVPSANTLTQNAAASDGDILAITSGAVPRAINFDDIATLVPRMPANAPGVPTPVYARNVALTAYAPDLSTAYTQNLTLSVTRSISRNVTLDVRYIGTLARKLVGNMDLNSSTVMYNPELFKALEVTRAGGNDPLFDQMFAGLRLAGVPGTVPLVNGTTSFGSDQLRQSTTFQGNLANGNFVAVANGLVTGTILAGSQGITGLTPGPQQTILRNGCNRIANGLYNPNLPASASNILTRCFAENYLAANPQVSGATYNGNFGRSNYHALQVGFTLRPTAGFSVQSTYSWTKAMQLPSSGYTDPLMREIDRVRSVDNLHNLRMNGTVELPIGPNKLLFANSSGWVARLIERWQTSFILNMSSGQPSSITGAGTMRYANARYVATVDWKTPEGHAEWNGPNGNTGTFFGTDNYFTTRDPQCTDTTVVAASLTTFCTLNALAVKAPEGAPRSFALSQANPVNVVYGLLNPLPGQIGTFGNRTIDSWGQFFLDANIQKSFQISESKALSIRVDATNILNHPQLATPNFAVNNTAFGNIASKGGAINGGGPVQRNFQGQVRLTF
jgi:hypothetical protein